MRTYLKKFAPFICILATLFMLNSFSVSAAENPDYLFLSQKAADQTIRNVSSFIAYKSHDGSEWFAELVDGRFKIYPEGNKNISHTSDSIDYVQPSGRLWRATFEDGEFRHTAVSGEATSHVSNRINYVSWDGNEYTANLVTWRDEGFDKNTQNKTVFGFKENGQERISTISTEVYYQYINTYNAVEDFVFEYFNNKFTYNNRSGSIVNHSGTPILFTNDGLTNHEIAIENNRFKLDGNTVDSIMFRDWDENLIEVFVLHWYDF